METGCIYSIICKVNGKRYVGQTRQELAKRWKQHITESRQFSDRPLYRAMCKYGVGMFNIRILEDDIPVDLLSQREQHWIEQFDSYLSGYNATTGGEVGNTIREDVKEKISQTMTGLQKSDNHIASISKGLKSINHRFKNPGNGKHARMKVRGTHIQTGEVVEYNSITDACKSLSLKQGNLSRAIKKGYMHGGYKWQKLTDKTMCHAIYGKCVLTGKILYQFDSIRAAGRALSKHETNGSGCSKALKNPSRYTWKGCRWYYQTNDD